jgi:thiamine kinase-like enzyme
MVLTIENICDYLLENQLIDKKAIIEGDLLIRDVSSRNTNFLVNQFHENGIKILIKQPDINDDEYIESMKVEAGIYQLIFNNEAFEQVKHYLPKFNLYDSQNYILIMEQISGVCRVFDYLFHGLNLPDKNISEHFATALASLHNIKIEQSSFSEIPKSYPWFLNVGQKSYQKKIKKSHPETYQYLSEIFENKKWMAIISSIKRNWQEENIIHLDSRFTNWMISFRHQPTQNDPLWLIDWEMAGKGDSAWDIAFLIGEWINLGLFFQESHPTVFPDVEQTIKTQINIFWKNYVDKRGFFSPQKKDFQKRVCRYLTLRILMMVYEIMVEYEEESETTITLINLFKNVIEKPQELQKKYFYD